MSPASLGSTGNAPQLTRLPAQAPQWLTGRIAIETAIGHTHWPS